MRAARPLGQFPLLFSVVVSLAPGCSFSGLGEDSSAPRDCETRSVSYRDADGDGYGDSLEVVVGCSVEEGYAEKGGDCDDTRPEMATICWSTDTGPRDTGPTDTGPTDTGPTDTAAPPPSRATP